MDLYSVADTSALEEFRTAVRPALVELQRRLGFARWTIARKQDDDLIVVASLTDGILGDGGEVYRWSESLCARMVLGLGPRFAPDIARVAVYSHAPYAASHEVGAYLGVPLHDTNGLLIGSLSATDPHPVAGGMAGDVALVESVARLVAATLSAHLRFDEQGRLAERALVEASTDALTGLANRRTWEWVLKAEEDRCRRFNRAATILCLDLDELKIVNDTLGHDAGDELLLRASRAISTSVRAPDVVARLGGDEFGVVAVETDADAAAALTVRLKDALRARGVSASIGWATLGNRGLRGAWAEADAAMYAAKRAARQR